MQRVRRAKQYLYQQCFYFQYFINSIFINRVCIKSIVINSICIRRVTSEEVEIVATGGVSKTVAAQSFLEAFNAPTTSTTDANNDGWMGMQKVTNNLTPPQRQPQPRDANNDDR